MIDRLREALRDRYLVDREIGRGGMGRVFVARDLRHDRDVAIKVLHPELAPSLGAERFLREIRTAAGMTHPHILPVHDSGEALGLLYYVMPYIAGETLGERLHREGRMAVADALALAAQVADALVYAHASGIVHRDLKPENILLPTPAHAVLADFGLARAVQSATTRRLTPTGFLLGSPLYMSPEQAEGNRPVDGRADVYSLGCILFEMLAGQPPFSGPTPQAVLLRKVTGEPTALRALRPDLPEEVEALVRKAMERDPDRRFQTAEELARALRAAPTERRRRGLSRAAVGAVSVVAVAAVAVGVIVGTRRGSAPTADDPARRVLLADFQAAVPGDSTLASMATVLLRTDLSQSRRIDLVEAERVEEALRRMQRPETARLTPELAREVAIREGIPVVILPRLLSAGGRYALAAEIVAPAEREVLGAADASASDSSALLEAVDELSERLRGRLGESLSQVRGSAPLAEVTTRSLPALRKYTLAGDAMSEGDYAGAVTLLQEAVALDSTFASAYHRLGLAIYNHEEHWERAIEMYLRAYRLREHLPERERYRMLGSYYEAIGDREAEIRAYRIYLEHYPASASVLNNLGVAYERAGDFRNALRHYGRAWRTDTTNRLAGSNLVQALYSTGNEAHARALNDTLMRRFPEFPNYPNNASLMLAGSRRYDEAVAWTVRLRGLEQASVSWRIWTGRRLAFIAAAQGRLTEAEEHLQGVIEEGRARGSRAGVVKTTATLAQIEAYAGRDPAAAVERMETVLALHPLETLFFLDRPYVELAQVYAAAGKEGRIRALIGEMERDSRPHMGRVADRLRPRMQAALALARGDGVEAVRQLRPLQAEDCPVCDPPLRALAHERAGAPDSAIAEYERYLAGTFVYRVETDAIWLGHAHERLARLYAQRGDRERSAAHRRALAALWRGADPRVRARLRELGAPGESP